ncbi:MAG: hypothetical protein SFW67_01000 [Myxococcaceae bacterium]|nr:hypothetical protein [Myxococcaceae bacterium]
MLAACLALTLGSVPWDGRSSIDLQVGEALQLDAPRPVRFVSVGASDVVELGVTKDLRAVQLKGLRRGVRTIVVHFQDRTRATLELRVSAALASARRGVRR